LSGSDLLMRDRTGDLIISAKNKSDQVKTKKSRLLLAEGPDDKVVFGKELACRTKAAMQNSHRFFSKIFLENFPPKKIPASAILHQPQIPFTLPKKTSMFSDIRIPRIRALYGFHFRTALYTSSFWPNG